MVNQEDYIEDVRPEEVYKGVEKRKEKKRSKILTKLPTATRWWIGIGVGVLVYYFWIIKQWAISKVILMVIFAAFIIWFVTSGEEEERFLTDLELKIELIRQLQYYQINPIGDEYVIPAGRIRIEPPSRLQNIERTPWKKIQSFSVKLINGLKKYFSADQSMKTGDILGIREGYFDGTGVADIRWITSPRVAAEKRYYEAGGKQKWAPR